MPGMVVPTGQGAQLTYGGGLSAQQQYNANGGALGGLGQALGTNSAMPVSGPDRSNYQFQGANGGAIQTQQYYQGLAAAAAQRQGAQIQNQYGTRDDQNTQGVLGQYGGLTGYYQNVLNGSQPSLAQAQMNASTEQAIRAQMSMAASARGGLSAAAAQMGAQQQGAQMLQGAAQQSMIGRIQEEQAAAQGLNAALGNQGQLALGAQGLNQQSAYEQAGLQQQQNALNNQAALGYAGLANQIGLGQLSGSEAYGQAGLEAQGQQLSQSEYNAGNNQAMLMGLMSAAAGGMSAGGGGAAAKGAAAAAADLDLGSGHHLAHAYADADLQEPGGPAAWTLREEPDFILAYNRMTGQPRKLATEPLTDREFRQAMMRPHGAGPIASDGANRERTVAHDFQMGAAPMMGGGAAAPERPPMQAGMAPAPQRPPMGAGMAVARPAAAYGGGMARPMGNYAGGGYYPQGGAGYGPGYGQPQRPTVAPMMGAGLRAAYADLDLAKAHHAKLGSGKRFAAIERSAAASGARDPAAVAAAAGRAAHGERAMGRYAAHGRK